MKQLISFLFLTLLLILGCNNESELTSPVENNTMQEPNWIALPQAEGIQVEAYFIKYQTIDGRKNTHFTMYGSYSGGPFGTVVIDADLFFPRLSFEGTQTFHMINDGGLCISTFGPSFEFNKVLTFNITYTGVDLTGINPSTVKFAYIAPDGSVQYAVNDGIIVDFATGKLQVLNAAISHFSRYGFVN
jgi:hypothetical protein